MQYVGNLDFFDTRTGEIYEYDRNNATREAPKLFAMFRLSKLGQPMIWEYPSK